MSDSKINTEEVEAKNWSVGNVTDDWIDINGWRHILLRNGKEFCFQNVAENYSSPTSERIPANHH